MRLSPFLLVVAATVFSIHAGEPALIEFDVFVKDLATEPLADHHQFTERVNAYFPQLERLEEKKFSSEKEKIAVQKMLSPVNLRWLLDTVKARLAVIRENPGDPTLRLSDPADLEKCLKLAQRRLDPNSVPPELASPPKFRLDPRSKATPLTEKQWPKVVELIERHLKHIEARKYDSIFNWDYTRPPADPDAEKKHIEKYAHNGKTEALKYFLQCRESAYFHRINALIVGYVPGRNEYWEMIITHQYAGEWRIDGWWPGLRKSPEWGISVIEEKKK